jgi:glyoxylase-like metal-dependent hydrolase (beta-lactamase superfamily II)
LENLLILTIQSTHFYLVDFGRGKIMVDVGWAGSLRQLKAALKSTGVEPREIRYLLATHYHPDHGGLVQEAKRDFGASLIIHERQLPGLEELRAFYARKGSAEYVPVVIEKGDLLLKRVPDDNRATLRALGIHGAIVETPGHSEDSVSLVLENGWAFTGDLHPPDYAPPESYQTICASWKKLLERGAKQFYPAHAGSFPAEEIRFDLC